MLQLFARAGLKTYFTSPVRVSLKAAYGHYQKKRPLGLIQKLVRRFVVVPKVLSNGLACDVSEGDVQPILKVGIVQKRLFPSLISDIHRMKEGDIIQRIS